MKQLIQLLEIPFLLIHEWWERKMDEINPDYSAKGFVITRFDGGKPRAMTLGEYERRMRK